MSVRGRLVWIGTLALAASLFSGCIVGSDDVAPTSTTESSPSVTATTAPSPTSTARPSATATTAPPTSTPRPPTPTATSTPRPTATATPIPKLPLGTINPLDPNAIPNFSLSTEVALHGVPNQSDFDMTLLILQAAPNHYYLRSTGSGAGLESWLVDGTSYLTQADGSVAQLPQGSDTALFSPALLVQTVPAISGDTLGMLLGDEDVAGRQAKHYRIEGADLVKSVTWLPGDSASEVEGQVDLWLDNELGIVLRQESDVRWENADGTPGSYTGRYEVTNISTTVPVTAPGS
ncbi:MAG TPA: hypothetical protein VEX37_01315 [Thermomicrobiales bacterium]|nr:hypothetical protein [Thermomicrobiales bacterium]